MKRRALSLVGYDLVLLTIGGSARAKARGSLVLLEFLPRVGRTTNPGSRIPKTVVAERTQRVVTNRGR